jgi:hypothetical protein
MVAEGRKLMTTERLAVLVPENCTESRREIMGEFKQGLNKTNFTFWRGLSNFQVEEGKVYKQDKHPEGHHDIQVRKCWCW